MHPYDIMLIVSIATAVTFTALIYVRRDLWLAFGSIAASILGAAAGGILGFRHLPMHPQFALILGATAGAVGLVAIVWRLRRRHDG